MDELEYITANALMMCDQGAAPDFFKPTFNTKVKIHGCLVATKVDFQPLTNIPSFKICMVTQKPCFPETKPWEDTWAVKINGEKSLIGRCTCKCMVGGTIEFLTSGQIPLPDDAQEEVENLQKQAQKELDDAGYGDSVGETGFVEGMIPVWGSGRDLINDIQTGDGWGIAMNAGFLIWDVGSIVAGIFSFGAGTAAMQGGKVGLKAGMKAGLKAIPKKVLAGLGKAGFKKLEKEVLKKSIDDVAKKLLKTCVFACFPAGTLVQTEKGTIPIEAIKKGDRVWSYCEETKEIALKEVLYTIERESDHTIKIDTQLETIETTALHPFYTQEGWKNASELCIGNKVLTKNNEINEIISIKFQYDSKKVYNFEVADWHTYFVGAWGWLVHNAKGRCISTFIKGIVGNRPLRELTHQELYNAFKKAGIELSNHAIHRLKDIRTKNLGFNTPNDIMKIFSRGNREVVERTVMKNGKEIVEKTVNYTYNGLKVITDIKTGRVITISPI